MANKLFPKGISHKWAGDIDWDAHTFKLIALTSAYTFSDSHEFVSSLSGEVARSAALASKTNTPGTGNCAIDAADTVFTAVAAGSTIARIVLYRDTGADGTSILLGYWDSFTATATNDNDITVAFNASGICVESSP